MVKSPTKATLNSLKLAHSILVAQNILVGSDPEAIAPEDQQEKTTGGFTLYDLDKLPKFSVKKLNDKGHSEILFTKDGIKPICQALGENELDAERLSALKISAPIKSIASILMAFTHFYQEGRQPNGRKFGEPLATEDPNKLTLGLAENAQNQPKKALEQCLAVDLECLQHLQSDKVNAEIIALNHRIREVLEDGNRIFIAGCGASGRLAMVLRNLLIHYDEAHETEYSKRVHIIMAGGDKALMSAIEKFEDQAGYGEQQLKVAGYGPSDLLIGISASGDAPFIQAMLRSALSIQAEFKSSSAPKPAAAEDSLNSANYQSPKPIMLISNSPEQVSKRNPKHVITQGNIDVTSIACGSPALSGSTRMQPSTAMLAALYTAFELAISTKLEKEEKSTKIYSNLVASIKGLSDSQREVLLKFIRREASAYKNQEHVYYRIMPNAYRYALSVFTDLTERSPTFTLPKIVPISPIRGQSIEKDEATAYLYLADSTGSKMKAEEAMSAEKAMHTILGRNPECLNWKNEPETSSDYFAGYDFSESGHLNRKKNHDTPSHTFMIDLIKKKDNTEYFLFQWDGELKEQFHIDITALAEIERELLLKILLNNHSTITMGNCGYYTSNFMRRVTPSNAKLHGRAIKYIKTWLNNEQQKDLEKHGKKRYRDFDIKDFLPSYLMQILRFQAGHSDIVGETVAGLLFGSYHFRGTKTAEAVLDPDYKLHSSSFKPKS